MKEEQTMEKAWVLSIRTSLPEVQHNKGELKTTFYVFDSFEEAKSAFRNVVKEYAFNENTMFDGAGNIKYLKKYFEELDMPEEPAEDWEYPFMEIRGEVSKVYNCIYEALAGKNVTTGDIPEYSTDYLTAIKKHEDMVMIVGEDDGPYNGYNPFIKTNIFNMGEEKDYYLYIDDMLGQDYSSELYIDLKKAEN